MNQAQQPQQHRDWPGWLLATLQNLRHRWPHAWPGLPVVAQACVGQLWKPKHAFSPSAQAMLQVMHAMAAHMEDIAHSAHDEPQYHNRLHTADALVSLTLLMMALQSEGHAVPDEWAAALLLAVTSHDVLHPGGANAFVQELEAQSVRELQRLASQSPIPPVWLERVSQLILHTDPALVPANHDKVASQTFVMNLDWAVVLTNEADILASATAVLGPGLGQQLALEWKVKQHPLHSSVGSEAGRLHFLSSLRFSSPASQLLQIPASVQSQIATLQARLAH